MEAELCSIEKLVLAVALIFFVLFSCKIGSGPGVVSEVSCLVESECVVDCGKASAACFLRYFGGVFLVKASSAHYLM